MTRESIEVTRQDRIYCLKASSDYHSELCEECRFYPKCDHMTQDDMTELNIKDLETLEQEPCENVISRLIVQEEISKSIALKENSHQMYKRIQAIPSVTPKFTDAEIQSNDCISRQTVLNTLFYKSDNNCEVVLNKELQDRIKALPSVTPTSSKMEQVEWILCSERLPEESGAYLVWMIWGDEEPTYSIINFDADYNEFGEWIEIYDINTLAVLDRKFRTYIDVFAWMPLPEPYVPEINVGKRAESEVKK